MEGGEGDGLGLHSLQRTHARTYEQTRAHTRAPASMHVRTHARTHGAQMHTHTRTPARAHARTRTQTLARTHAHARKCTHVCMRARAAGISGVIVMANFICDAVRAQARAPDSRARLARQNRAPNSPRAPKPNPCAAAGAALDRACGCGREALEAWALAGSAYRDRWAGGSGWRGERDAVRGRIFAKPASGGPGSQNRLSEPSPTCPSLRPPSWENYGHSALNAAMRGGHRPASFPCYSRGRTPPPFSCFEVSRH